MTVSPVKKLKSGKHTFTVKLDSSRGLKAQKKHKTLKVVCLRSGLKR